MARYKGHSADLTAGGSDIGECESFDLNHTIAEEEVSVIGSDWTSAEGLQQSMTGTVNVLRDPADTGQAALAVGSDVACVFYPESNTSGATSITVTMLVTGVTTSVAATGLVKDAYTLKNDGAATFGTVI